MSPKELARWIIRNYETHELEEAIADCIHYAIKKAYEDAAKVAALSSRTTGVGVSELIRQRMKEVLENP